MRQLLAAQRNSRWFAQAPTVMAPPLSPHHRRWYFARDALRRWVDVFRILGLDPEVFLLNPQRGHQRLRCSQIERVFAAKPQGTTPMTQVLQQALTGRADAARPLLVLGLTDGEADDMT